MIIKLWNFFRGYVVINIEGLALEKFINYAIARGVYLWDIVRIDYTTLEAKVGLEGYKELRHIVKRAGCKVKIHTRIGYPFFMHKIRVRKMFTAGFIIAILIVMVISSFIWNVEIKGNEAIGKEEIEKKLIELGLYPGIYKYDVDIPNIENSMMIQLENLAWIGISIKGTKAIVEVSEKIKPPARIPTNVPCDIVAGKMGVIEKVIAKNGDALIKKGDIVKKGEKLITGTINRDGVDTRYVHSMGDVYARTYYEERDEIFLVSTKKIKTGKKFVRKIIKIGNSEIISSSEEIPFNNVIIEKKNKSLSNWRNLKIPVEMIIEEYYEAVDKKEVIDKSVARKALQDKILVKLLSKMPENINILNQDIKLYEEDNKITADLTIEALEQIGVQQMIKPTY